MTFPAVRFTSTPCRMAASCTGAASIFSSRPHISPAPRISTIAGCFFCISRSCASRCAPVFLHVLHQAGGQLIEAHQRGTAREQVSTERRAVVAEGQRGRNIFLDERGAHGHAARQRLADRDQIGIHPELLEVERLSRAAQTALHFVGDQQRARPRADLVHRIGEFLRERTHAAFALNRLEDDRGRLFRHRLAQRRERSPARTGRSAAAARTASDSARSTSSTARPSSGRESPLPWR